MLGIHKFPGTFLSLEKLSKRCFEAVGPPKASEMNTDNTQQFPHTELHHEPNGVEHRPSDLSSGQ